MICYVRTWASRSLPEHLLLEKLDLSIDWMQFSNDGDGWKRAASPKESICFFFIYMYRGSTMIQDARFVVHLF